MFGLLKNFIGNFTGSNQRKAQRQARQQALEDEKRAKEAEVFAETEGQGLGNLGKVRLAVDDDLTEEEMLRRKGKVKAVL